MSMLLGPLSETISSVYWRASAFAGDQMAGAGSALPAARTVTDFRKSRRFMKASRCQTHDLGDAFRKRRASTQATFSQAVNSLI
jgi:hypothetical protein